MRFRIPKPLHGWREFAGEVGVIVLGVLIALAFEQFATEVRDQASARQARRAVYGEINQNLSYMQARMETQPCVERRLSEIGRLLANARDGELSPQPKWIGQPAIWINSDERWQAATSGGQVSLFSPDEQARLAAIYSATKQFIVSEEREQSAWAQLRGLESWTGPLGPEGRVHFISALQAARLELWETRTIAKIAFQRAKAIGVADVRPKVMTEGTPMPHAVCLPIDTPRERALQLLNGNSGLGGQPE
jgi:type II secretory pathway pseudopilin PulG